ncbi:MAG: TrkH family potassium uptake protein [Spirochaetales bacterium]|nr:TrkH family potassium uptake protein [Spirochaetales bacterium]
MIHGIVLALGLLGLVLPGSSTVFSQVVSLGVVIGTLVELLISLVAAPYKGIHVRRRWISYLTGVVGVAFLLGLGQLGETLGLSLLVLRSLSLAYRSVSRRFGTGTFFQNLTLHPAATLALSFFYVILGGTVYLMLPFVTKVPGGLSFLEALFTAASAVCVTGLIVVDTAQIYSFWGLLGIGTLIQIGGLGIMIFTYTAVFGLRKSVGLEDKIMLSYMMNQQDYSQLARGLTSMVAFTFLIEGIGAGILFGYFWSQGFDLLQALGFGVFHAISAFCNAGFALFTDSLEGFVTSPVLNGTIAILIILGGLSFPVLTNLREWILGRRNRSIPVSLSFNTRVVLGISSFLLLSGTLLIYGLEYRNALSELPIGAKYLASFFQSVTLRTAGFNTINLASLSDGLTLVTLVFMFIGGASGSTAGGIKVNTLGALGATLWAQLKGYTQVKVGKEAIAPRIATNSLFLFFFGIVVVGLGLFGLLVTNDLPFLDLAFETVSAFGTVGLSRGITADLNSPGRVIVIALMFIGRVGPMTLLSALKRTGSNNPGVFPERDIFIG